MTIKVSKFSLNVKSHYIFLIFINLPWMLKTFFMNWPWSMDCGQADQVQIFSLIHLTNI